MNPLEAFFIGAVTTAIVLVVWAAKRSDDDALAGIVIGRDDGARPQLIATRCCSCGRVKCTDRVWRHGVSTMIPLWAVWSDGYCQTCYYAQISEVESGVANAEGLILQPAPARVGVRV